MKSQKKGKMKVSKKNNNSKDNQYFIVKSLLEMR